MIPFRLPPKQKKQVDKNLLKREKVINAAINSMELVMKKAVDSILDHYQKTGMYAEPSLNEMFNVSEDFYKSLVTKAFLASKEEKKSEKKRLAKLPIGLPRNFKDLEKLFKDRKYWPKIMKRSTLLTDKMRKQYLQKLRKKFSQIIPLLKEGKITPQEVKKEMMKSWSASKSRVETIFRTETTTYFGKTQVAFFKGDSDIIGYLFDSVRDTARTEICRSRHGLVYRPDTKLLTENVPALHFNCRSHLIALADTPSNRKLLEDPTRDPTKKIVAPLPKGWRK